MKWLLSALLLSVTSGLLAANPEPPKRGDSFEGVSFRIAAGRPEGVAAFYEARGFPPQAIGALREACFLNVVIRNQRVDIVWLELDRWRFIDETGRTIERLTPAHWNAQWDRLNLPVANRATFGWTQLPEVRDLRPDEPVGGNVLIMPPPGRFRLEARFATGANKSGPDIVVSVDPLTCRAPIAAPAP